SWSPIGAIQTASGYDIAWKMAGTDQYGIWTTDINGNYISNLTPAVSGSSTTLENFEAIFPQDLNGDGTIGVPAGTSPASAHVAQTSQPAFNGQTLPHGTPAGAEQADLRGFDSNALHTDFDSASGTLSVSTGSSSASLQFLGQYSQDSFHFAGDGNGGTLVVATTQAAATTKVSSFAAHDTFVFAP